jgi:hypothetical protein
MSAIFISHSSKDHAVASELQARLSEQGLRLNGNVGEILDRLLVVLERNGHISVVRRASQ